MKQSGLGGIVVVVVVSFQPHREETIEVRHEGVHVTGDFRSGGDPVWTIHHLLPDKTRPLAE